MYSPRPDKAVGRPCCKNFLIIDKISHKLKCLNFKCELNEDTFWLNSVGFSTIPMSHAKNFDGDRPKVRVLRTLP